MLNPQHKAQLDENGNIIIPGPVTRMHTEPVRAAIVEEGNTMIEGVWYSPEALDEPVQKVIEEPVAELPAWTEPVASPKMVAQWTVEETTEHVWADVRHQIHQVTQSVLTESTHQYVSTIQDGKRFGKNAKQTVSATLPKVWSFLTQPVWVPGKRNQPVQYSRGTLFALDTVRFGGTFAAIFTLLFVGLNYQSFWSIAESYVDPLAEVTGIKTSNDSLGRDVAAKLKRIPSLAVAGQGESALLDYLPPVGPPDNRLIIPSLDLNVPIVIPPNDALLNEDWKALEESIQEGLQNGVVHYPGTARPGQAGNFFLTGHSSYFPWAPGEYKSVFARLHNLNVGDEYWIFYNGDRYRYVVQEKKEIKPSDVSVLDQPVNKRIATLMTCTPVGTTLRRLIIVSQEVDPVSGLALEVGEHRQEELPSTRMELLPI